MMLGRPQPFATKAKRQVALAYNYKVVFKSSVALRERPSLDANIVGSYGPGQLVPVILNYSGIDNSNLHLALLSRLPLEKLASAAEY